MDFISVIAAVLIGALFGITIMTIVFVVVIMGASGDILITRKGKTTKADKDIIT